MKRVQRLNIVARVFSHPTTILALIREQKMPEVTPTALQIVDAHLEIVIVHLEPTNSSCSTSQYDLGYVFFFCL